MERVDRKEIGNICANDESCLSSFEYTRRRKELKKLEMKNDEKMYELSVFDEDQLFGKLYVGYFGIIKRKKEYIDFVILLFR